MCTTQELNASSTGRTRATASSEPPTIATSRPSAAATGPPDTPQSTSSHPDSTASSAMRLTVEGEIVDTTMNEVPGSADPNAPFGPESTSVTCASSITATTTTSTCPARETGSGAIRAVCSNAAVASGLMSQTTSSSPARATLVATPRPISPRPITPTLPVMFLDPLFHTGLFGIALRAPDRSAGRCWTPVQTVVCENVRSRSGIPPPRSSIRTVTDLFESTRRYLSPRQAGLVDRVVEAAASEAREHGYEGLTVRGAARRAGVAPATAYTYFASKDHLLAEILWRRLESLPPVAPDPALATLERVTEELGPARDIHGRRSRGGCGVHHRAARDGS